MSTTATAPLGDEGIDVPSSRLDKVGIAASLACAVHCMVAPFILLLLPAAGSAWAHPAVHWVLAALVLPLAVFVIYRGYLRHRRRATLAGALAGATFIVAGLLLPNAGADAHFPPRRRRPRSAPSRPPRDTGPPAPTPAARASFTTPAPVRSRSTSHPPASPR